MRSYLIWKPISSIVLYLVFPCAIISDDRHDVDTAKLAQELKQYEAQLGHCEYSALRLGSKIADVFNAPVGDEDWDERIHQDFIVENLGFAPFMADGISRRGGNTLTNKNAKELYNNAGWGGSTDTDHSPYAILNHKWIYMFGDSTTRQVWASFAAPFQGNHFERNAKEYVRSYCNAQEHRIRHHDEGPFQSEGWRGPCGKNEVTCHVSGYGSGGLLSLDWKHFPYEDYDQWMWSDQGPWISGFPGEGTRRPDILTLQMGMHSCWHANPQGLYSKHLTDINRTMVAQHEQDVRTLFAAVRKAIDHPVMKQGPPNGDGVITQPTTVIVLTSGAVGMGEAGNSIDDCILRFNRIVTNAAHAQGFAVLDRGEIERRLMAKSFMSDKPYLTQDMHLPQPAQNLIATCLMHIMSCLNSTLSENSFDIASALAHRHITNKSTPPARPMHVPPPG